jgi:hypothetical protein
LLSTLALPRKTDHGRACGYAPASAANSKEIANIDALTFVNISFLRHFKLIFAQRLEHLLCVCLAFDHP